MTSQSDNPPFDKTKANFIMGIMEQSYGPYVQQLDTTKHRLAKIDTNLAHEYGALCAIHVDLRFTQHMCERILGKSSELRLPAASEDHLGYLTDTQKMAMIGALVSYVRCFGEGKRMRLSVDQIWHEDDPARLAHQYFKDVRDKFVTHSVNDFEDTGVGLSYADEDGQSKIIAVTDVFRSSMSPDDYLTTWLKRLSVQAQEHAINRIEELRDKLISYGEQLSLEDLDALPRFELDEKTFDAPEKPRR